MSIVPKNRKKSKYSNCLQSTISFFGKARGIETELGRLASHNLESYHRSHRLQ